MVVAGRSGCSLRASAPVTDDPQVRRHARPAAFQPRTRSVPASLFCVNEGERGRSPLDRAGKSRRRTEPAIVPTMDLSALVVIVLGILALWVVLLLVFWALRPRGVSGRELVSLIPDVLSLLRSLITDRSAPLD